MLKRAKEVWNSLVVAKSVLPTISKGSQGYATSMEDGKEHICSPMPFKAGKLQAQSLVEVSSHGEPPHGIIEEMNATVIPVGIGVYSSLLKAYCKAQRTMEVFALLKEVRKVGIQLDGSCYDALIESHFANKNLYGALDLFKEKREAKVFSFSNSCQSQINEVAKESKPILVARLLDEFHENQQVTAGTHDWNSIIHFFCKAHLMNDAQKAYKKMTALGYHPNTYTFHSLIHRYSTSGGMYQEITMLWLQIIFLMGFPLSCLRMMFI